MPHTHDYPFDRRGGGSHLHPLRRPPWPGPLLLRLVGERAGWPPGADRDGRDAFDLLYRAGRDLTKRPLRERRARLEEVLAELVTRAF